MTNFQKHLATLGKTVYPEPKLDYHEKLIDTAIDVFVKGKFKDVLDVGFGTGYSLNKFKELGLNVTGITLDEQEMNHDNVKLMDMAFLDFPDNSFDLVWCRHSLEHSVMPMIALLEFKRVLRDGGHLYVEVPQDESVHVDNPNHYSMFSDRSWQSLFRKAEFRLLNRGQWVIHLDGWIDLYWHYWLKK
jgi:ubiquinone/menaquinone biosynthesis C-methylase UbiE